MIYHLNFDIQYYRPSDEERYILQGIIFCKKDARTFDLEPFEKLPDNVFNQIYWNIVPYSIEVKNLVHNNLINAPGDNSFNKEYFTLNSTLRLRYVSRHKGMKSETPSDCNTRDALRPFSIEGIPLYP